MHAYKKLIVKFVQPKNINTFLEVSAFFLSVCIAGIVFQEGNL